MGCLGSEVEYAVIPTELDESADVHGDDLSDAAKQCRFRALVVVTSVIFVGGWEIWRCPPANCNYYLMFFLNGPGQHGKLQNLQNFRTLKGSYFSQPF